MFQSHSSLYFSSERQKMYFTVSTTQKKKGNIVSLLLGMEREHVVWPKSEWAA